MKLALPAKVQRLATVLIEGAGRTAGDLRRAIAGRAAELAGGRAAGAVPADVADYVDKVGREAYRVTDSDVAALKAKGYTEEQIFEITVAAAVGAGVARMERALAALEGSR
jgi:alkylhydroperoxidase family enzyme